MADRTVDVVVVGAGIAGIAATHRLQQAGLSVLGLEKADGVGGVWYHNRYPGARVDLEGIYYSYFDPQLYREWQWKDRYPGQPELLAYLNFAADRWDVKRLYQFNTTMTGAQWDATDHRYTVTTDTGLTVRTRFLVMATGPLSQPRQPNFPGLDTFQGEWHLTAQWPREPVAVAGRRVGVVGTSATGVQVIPILAEQAEHLTVFQRTPNYSVPAHNGPADPQRHAEHVARIDQLWQEVLKHPGGTDLPLAVAPTTQLTPEERQAILDERWAYGGHAMQSVFTDQGVDPAANEIIAEYVRAKVRELVHDPVLAEKLTPRSYPFGTRRLCVDTNYYQTFNRDNVTLVDLREDPIETFTPKGIRTRSGEVELDLVVFATGFLPFTGSLYPANIRNECGEGLPQFWARGPRTFLGLMVHGLPNMFLLTGPGSPSVLANFFPSATHQAELLATVFAHMAEHGYTRVEASEEAQAQWSEHCAEVAAPTLRLKTENYMVHVNDDGSRVFIPYYGGFDRYVRACAEVEANGLRGFEFAA